jgi:hypothetical protein
MISVNSLSAFSGATATAPLNRNPVSGAGGVQPARLLRGGAEQPGAQPQAASPPGGLPPKGPLPRGSLLNLAV